jgi:hypothetical protein
MHDEPKVIVNGVRLTEAQAMTFRVAIENFAATLSDEKFARDLGQTLATGYLARINEIREAIFTPYQVEAKKP